MKVKKKVEKIDVSIYDDINLTLGDRAFLTGSHAYGTPREDSDIDIVILIEQNVLRILNENTEDQNEDLGYRLNRKVIRFGKLNIIPFCEKDKFDIWKKINEELIAEKPVTREYAAFKLRAALGE